jgi:uncharacterized protein
MKFKKLFFLVPVLIVILICIDIFIETNYPVISRVEIETTRVKAGKQLNILQITDLHDKQFGQGNSELLKLVRKTAPDIIVITGDLVDVKTKSYKNAFSLAGKLIEITPQVYFVQGNHEHWNKNEELICNGLAVAGIKVLNNMNAAYTKDNESYNICGIDYPYANAHGEYILDISVDKMEKAFEGIDRSSYTILLCHTPKITDYKDILPADLILSGHTHGGQVRLPFIGSVMRLNPDFFGRYDKGLFKLDNGAELYVDSGVGTSIYPVRFDDRAQISLISVKGIGAKGK